MNKTRLENLSDGVFAIVITLLVFDIKVPENQGRFDSNFELLQYLIRSLSPVLISYVVSFLIVAIFWLSHHTLFHFFTKTINRLMVTYNSIFLFLLSLIPFSARLLAQYHGMQLAYIIYGVNILLLALMNLIMQVYSIRSHQIENFSFKSITLRKSRIRVLSPLVCTVIGITVSFVSLKGSLLMLVLPILINLIPAIVDWIEKISRVFAPYQPKKVIDS
jgi:uncharacterized membrane protein